MSLADVKRADRRLLMLRALASENDYSISDVVLRGLLAEFGHAESADTIRADVAWLSEQGLTTIETVGSMAVATITERGADVASGAAIVPGIRRPRPGE